MFVLDLKGQLTSKFSTDVPVIRKWKLVWERRDFGTRIDKIDKTVPLRFASYDEIPEIGFTQKVDGHFSVLMKKAKGSRSVVTAIMYDGVEIPGTHKTHALPEPGSNFSNKILAWHTPLWKGVQLDLEGVLRYEP